MPFVGGLILALAIAVLLLVRRLIRDLEAIADWLDGVMPYGLIWLSRQRPWLELLGARCRRFFVLGEAVLHGSAVRPNCHGFGARHHAARPRRFHCSVASRWRCRHPMVSSWRDLVAEDRYGTFKACIDKRSLAWQPCDLQTRRSDRNLGDCGLLSSEMDVIALIIHCSIWWTSAFDRHHALIEGKRVGCRLGRDLEKRLRTACIGPERIDSGFRLFASGPWLFCLEAIASSFV